MVKPNSDDKRPTPDHAEDNAFFPSPYSLRQFTAPKSNLSGADYPDPYKGGRWKILMIGADERYLLTDNVLCREAALGLGQQVSSRRRCADVGNKLIQMVSTVNGIAPSHSKHRIQRH